jgi:hypothetical protein
LAGQFPDIYSKHQRWVSRLKEIRMPHVKVLDYFGGIPGDDGGPRFWNDGVHFTCRGVIEMLGREI